MVNQDIAEQSEACLSLKKRLLTSLWEDVNPLISEVLKLSRHPTEEDAVLELSRSELLFLALLQALRSKDMVMSGRLLTEVDNWKVLPRLSFYLGIKLHVEFNCPSGFFSNAADYAHSLNSCGLFRAPVKVLAFLDHLAECERKEVEAISSESQDLHAAGDTDELSVQLNQTKKRGYRRRKKSRMDGPQQVCETENLPSSQTSLPSNASVEHQAAGTTPSCSSTGAAVDTPRPNVQRSAAEIERATKALSNVLGTNKINSMISAIERGADIQRIYFDMGTPLHWASYHGHGRVIEALIKCGVNLEAVEKYGKRALHIAAEMGRDDVIIQLVEAGADLNAIDAEGKTPLQRAIDKGRLTTEELLLLLGEQTR